MENAISVTVKDFRHAVNLAGKAVEHRHTMPVLEQLRVRANGSFEVAGTDLDMTVTASVARAGNAETEFMLSRHRSIAHAAKLAGGEDISFSLDGDTLSIDSGQMGITLKSVIPAEEFPRNDLDNAIFSATLSIAQISSLSRIAKSISTEETRYYLNGVYFHHIAGTTYRAVATNGHIMSAIDLQILDGNASLEPVIIPRKALRILLEIAEIAKKSGDDGVRLRIGNRSSPNRETTTAPDSPTRIEMSFPASGASVRLVSKLIDGKFPDYAKVIPNQDGKRAFEFDRVELTRAVKAVSGREKSIRAVKLVFGKDGCLISANNECFGAKINVACVHRSDDYSIGFNGQYLVSLLDAAGGERFHMCADDPSDPVLMRNPADTAWMAVLMPMRV